MKRFILPIVLAILIPTSVSASPWWIWAQFAIGGGYRSRLMITNRTIFPWKGTARIQHGREQPWSGNWSVDGQDFTGQSEFPLELDPDERISLIIDGDELTRTGSLEIDVEYGSGSSTSSRALDISLFVEYWSQDGRLLEIMSFPPSEATHDSFVFPIERRDDSDFFIDSALAWYSRYNVPFEIVLILYDHQGIEITRESIVSTVSRITLFGSTARWYPPGFHGFNPDIVPAIPAG